MTDDSPFPRMRPVADRAILVEFATVIGHDAHRQVTSLDIKLAQSPFHGFTEAVPASVSLLVCFDPTLTDHPTVQMAVKALLASPLQSAPQGSLRYVDICYERAFAPDLKAVSLQTGFSEEAVINAHLATVYHVVMYGFAPGYAYLGGGPSSLHLPRKTTAKRGVAAGSVIIAATQCLITTLTMPTGWWVIGHSPVQILTDDPAKPFLFDVGDEIRFRRIDSSALKPPKDTP